MSFRISLSLESFTMIDDVVDCILTIFKEVTLISLSSDRKECSKTR
jgi:hypothetical protein